MEAKILIDKLFDLEESILHDENELVNIKEKAKNDLFYFAKNILGYNKLSKIHEIWCADLKNCNCNRQLLLKPRSTYKTTIYSVADILHKIVNNHDFTCLVISASEEIPKQILTEIKYHIEKNETFIKVFGSLKSEDRWHQKSIRVTGRTQAIKEDTVSCLGMFSRALVGKHVDMILCDDIVDDNDKISEIKRNATNNFFNELIPVLKDKNSVLRFVGTRHHMDDLYNHIIKNLSSEFYSEVETAINKDTGESNYKDIFTIEDLENIKVQMSYPDFCSQYLNDPLPSESALFTLDSLEFFNINDINLDKLEIYFGIDLALGGTKGDYSSISVVGKDKNNYLYAIDNITIRQKPLDFIMTIIDYYKLYKPRKIYIETNVFQVTIADILIQKSVENGLYLPIHKIKNTQNKELRISSLEPITKLYLKFRTDWERKYPLLIEQLLQFPLGSNDDAPDSLELVISKIRPKANNYSKNKLYIQTHGIREWIKLENPNYAHNDQIKIESYKVG